MIVIDVFVANIAAAITAFDMSIIDMIVIDTTAAVTAFDMIGIDMIVIDYHHLHSAKIRFS